VGYWGFGTAIPFCSLSYDSIQQVIEEVQVGNLLHHFGLAFAVSNTPAGSHTVALACSSGTGGMMPIHNAGFTILVVG
jgi:hypothetical protein